MDKIHRRLGRLGFGAKRAMAISRLEKMATDPELIKKIASVKDERKKAALKKVKYERRANNLDDEMAKEKDRTVVSGHEAAKRDSSYNT